MPRILDVAPVGALTLGPEPRPQAPAAGPRGEEEEEVEEEAGGQEGPEGRGRDDAQEEAKERTKDSQGEDEGVEPQRKCSHVGPLSQECCGAATPKAEKYRGFGVSRSASAVFSRIITESEGLNKSMSRSFCRKDSGQEIYYKSAFATFIKTDSYDRHPVLRRMRQVLNSNYTESFVSFVIVANFFLIIIDTDARAGSASHDVPAWVDILDSLCFGVFVIELAARFACETRPCRETLKSAWMVMDTIIVVVGTLDYLARILMGLRLEVVRFLRLVRLLRILRVLRLFSVLRELKRLIQMMGGCFKTLFWSCLLLLIVMTTWAVIAVDLINPYILDLEATGVWSDCSRCYRSFGSVFEANLTLFQTVVAGDSWGSIAVPVIEYRPWTAVFFVGSLMTLVFGVLNLIVAVIVDVFAESRERDFLNRADELAEEERHQKKLLSQIFDKIDEDGNGSLSYDELVKGAYKVAEIARCLRVMDIDVGDLEQLFKIVDKSGSGEINPEEFIEAMYRMKNADSKTATKFVKHIVTRMDEDNRELREKVTGLLNHLDQSNPETLAPQIEEELREKLQIQELRISQAIETAVSKASQVALQAAMSAATEAASDVMGQVNKQSKHLAHSVAARMDLQPGSGGGSLARSVSWVSRSGDVSRSTTKTGRPREHHSLLATCLTRFGGKSFRTTGEVATPAAISAPHSWEELSPSSPLEESLGPEPVPCTWKVQGQAQHGQDHRHHQHRQHHHLHPHPPRLSPSPSTSTLGVPGARAPTPQEWTSQVSGPSLWLKSSASRSDMLLASTTADSPTPSGEGPTVEPISGVV